MAEDENPTGRITNHMLYAKQLENEKLLIELAERLAHMEQIPARVRELELQQAKAQWIEKVAYVALTAGVGSIIAALMQVM